MPVRRRGIAFEQQVLVWVRSGGHCALCHAYLLESGINLKPVKLGELAHIVAQSDNSLAPRSLVELPKPDRDLAENLLLACPTCHTDIDKRLQAKVLDVGWLLTIKQRHEERIRRATTLAAMEKSVVLRLIGGIRGAVMEVGPLEAVSAVVLQAERHADLALDPNRAGAEIDLRALPGEQDPIVSGYYVSACQRIDMVINERVRPAVDRGEIEHLSVFGLARLPLLVYFGSRLDDGVSAEIFQRQRATESWSWQETGDVEFRYSTSRTGEPHDKEAVLIVNASGTIDESAIPVELRDLPHFLIDPVDATPHRDIIATRRARDSFHTAVSNLLGHIERHHKPVQRLHLIAAAPVSAGIILGRSVGWGFHPTLVVYDAVGDSYRPALEVTAP
ncbi:MAG: hypothetical protein JWN67_1144 [Actinomycetia bacterium]|nr:hypothetical protein [Actinomycetes bacterium]